jgi:hypothetical protein
LNWADSLAGVVPKSYLGSTLVSHLLGQVLLVVVELVCALLFCSLSSDLAFLYVCSHGGFQP